MRVRPDIRNIAIAAALAIAAPGVYACTAPSPETAVDPIDFRLSQLSVHERAALIVAALLHLSGDTVPERLWAEIATGAAGALLVRSTDAPAAREALHRLRAVAPSPLLVIADLDSVAMGAAGLAPARAVALLAEEATARDVGAAAAHEALALGADIGVVSLPGLNGDEPRSAASLDRRRLVAGIVAYLEGARGAGLGIAIRALASDDTSTTVLRWDLARLESIELRELGEVTAEGDPLAVELGGVWLPALTGDTLPLPLSPAGVGGLLRRDLDYGGVVMVDLSPSSSLVRGRAAPAAALEALTVGADLLLGVDEPALVVDAIADAVANGSLSAERLRSAARRVLRMRAEVAADDSTRAARRVAGIAAPGRAGAEHAAVLMARAVAASSPRGVDSVVAAFRSGRGPDFNPAAGGDGDAAGSDGEGVVGVRGEVGAAADAAPPVVWPPAPVLAVAAPSAVGMAAGLGGRIDALMRRALEDSVFSAAAVAVGRRGSLVVLRGYGRSGLEGEGPAVNPRSTVFDLASLTKVVGTTTAVGLLLDDGRMELDAPVRRYLPEFRGEGKDQVRIRHLLSHTSGLPSGLWIFGSAGSPTEGLRQLLAQPLVREPDERVEYSDIGMMLLAAAAERAAEMPLDRLLATRVFAPLGMQSTLYLPPLALYDSIVPTAGITERDFPLKGVVHDANSFRLGGVAGHAGLFSTAADLAVFAQTVLNGGSYGTLRILSDSIVRMLTTRQPGAEQRALGWDTPSAVSSAGAYFSARSFGHTGYTGTSLWIDPEKQLFVVLLTNRTYVKASGGDILRLRAAVHDAAARAITDQPVRRRPGAR